MENKKLLTLDECTLKITDGTHSTIKDDINGNCFLLSCKNVKDGKIVIGDNERRINKEQLDILRKRTGTQKNDVLITTVGTIGQSALIRDDMINYEFQRSVAILRPNAKIINPEYLYYLTKTKDFIEQSLGLSSGSVQKCLFLGNIKAVKIEVPSLKIQDKIVSILSSLDDKIELNNEMNKTLEEMAQAIFKSWFVDFEPFKNGEFEESEFGMIPKGWKVSTIGKIADVKGGKRLPKGTALLETETEYPYLRVTDVTSGNVDLSQIKYIEEDVHKVISRYIINEEDIYISIAGTIGVSGIIPKSINGANLTENMAKIIPNNVDYRNFILLYLNSKKGKEFINSRIVGSTQPKLPLYNIKDIPILFDEEIIIEFNKKVSKIVERIQCNLEQSYNIKQIRDTLLPKLISGEIEL